MTRTLSRTLALWAIVAIGSRLAAADLYTYIVVLHDSVAAGEPSEPDIAALGGEVLHRSENRRVVHVTAAAGRALAAHPSVKYMQRVQVGGEVPLLQQSPAVAATTVAVNDSGPPTWTSGDFGYDGDGNITAIGSDSYAYDSASRLVSASIAQGTTQLEQYAYDSFGNLVATTRTAGPSTSTPASPATNRLTTAAYDSAGNVTASESGTTEYHYDGFNMLRAKSTSTGTAWYVYTAEDERIGAYENGEQRWMIRDLSGKVLREWRDGGLVWIWREDYVYRNGALVAAEREPAEGGTRHFHLDHLGTPRLITDQARLKIALHDYFPFGVEKTSFRQEMLERGTHWPEDMKFTGHERDFTGGIATDNRNQLDYMHARYYGPVWGRFLSVDPQRQSSRLGVPQSWNRYTYSQNNPLKYVDPDGRDIRLATGPQSEAVRGIVITALQRASARRALTTLARDREFVVTYGHRTLNRPEHILHQMLSRQMIGLRAPVEHAQTSPVGRAPSRTGANVDFDTFSLVLHVDPSGMWTFGHEHVHVFDMRRQIPHAELYMSHENGRAEAQGRALVNEVPDASPEYAETFLTWLLNGANGEPPALPRPERNDQNDEPHQP